MACRSFVVVVVVVIEEEEEEEEEDVRKLVWFSNDTRDTKKEFGRENTKHLSPLQKKQKQKRIKTLNTLL